jgi:hypothetical protein
MQLFINFLFQNFVRIYEKLRKEWFSYTSIESIQFNSKVFHRVRRTENHTLGQYILTLLECQKVSQFSSTVSIYLKYFIIIIIIIIMSFSKTL